MIEARSACKGMIAAELMALFAVARLMADTSLPILETLVELFGCLVEGSVGVFYSRAASFPARCVARDTN